MIRLFVRQLEASGDGVVVVPLVSVNFCTDRKMKKTP